MIDVWDFDLPAGATDPWMVVFDDNPDWDPTFELDIEDVSRRRSFAPVDKAEAIAAMIDSLPDSNPAKGTLKKVLDTIQ
jgi:hypothetical protein